jgi:tetratricopeptide (TPR) repeat protein
MSKLHEARGSTLSRRQELSEALRLNPYLVQVRVELAELLLASNATKTALELLNETPDAQKRMPAVLVPRNWALWTLGNLAEMRKGIDVGLSEQRSPELLIQDGLWRLRAGDASHGRQALEEALKVSPGNPRAVWALHQSYFDQKQDAIGLQKLKEYLVQNQKSAPAQEIAGLLLSTKGDLAGARTAFEAAKAADRQVPLPDLLLAQMDLRQGKNEDARTRLRSVVSADPRNMAARMWLGYVEEIMGEHKAALDQYRRIVDAEPTNSEALNNLAYELGEYANQPDEALKYAEKAQELAPDLPDYADTLGWVLYRKGLYSNAIKYLERAAAENRNAVSKYHLAMAYAKAGDPKRGKATLDAARRVNPNLPEAKMAAELIGKTQ